MDANATKSLETFASIRTALDVKSDEEAVAAVAALRQTAGQVPALSAKVAELSAQLSARDAAETAKARAAVLDKHRQRGALTPAMEADASFAADLAPLGAESLDRVLARLPSAPVAVAPRASAVIDPSAAVDPATIELTAEDKAWAKSVGLSEETLLATKRADAERAQSRRG